MYSNVPENGERNKVVIKCWSERVKVTRRILSDYVRSADRLMSYTISETGTRSSWGLSGVAFDISLNAA